MKDKQRDEAMELVKRGVPMTVVAAQYGCSRQYISAEAKRRGIKAKDSKKLSRKLWKTLIDESKS